MNLNKVLISMIIPVYNAENYIDTCMDSILSQSNDSIEIILVNDGSKDSSKELCEKYSLKSKNIITINQENLGVSAARNKGLEMASGKYVGFIDIDDTIKSNTFNILTKEVLKEDNDLIIWGIECTQHFEDGAVKREVITHETINFNIIDFQENLYKYFNKWYLNYTWNKLYKKSIIEDNNLKFDIDMTTSEDLLFNSLYLRKCRKVKILKDVLYNYRKISSTSLTRKYHRNQYDMQKRAYNQLVLTLKNANKYNAENKATLNDYYIKFAYTVVYNTINKNLNLSKNEKKVILNDIKKDNNLKIILKENITYNKFNKVFYYSLKLNSISAITAVSKAFKTYNYLVHGWYRN